MWWCDPVLLASLRSCSLLILARIGSLGRVGGADIDLILSDLSLTAGMREGLRGGESLTRLSERFRPLVPFAESVLLSVVTLTCF